MSFPLGQVLLVPHQGLWFLTFHQACYIPVDMANKSDLSPDELKIKATIEKIRPYLRQDGGDVSFRSYDVKTGVVTLELVGSCDGCLFATDEISFGVQSLLEKEIPNVKKVKLVQPDGEEYGSSPFFGFYPGFPNGRPTIDPMEGLRGTPNEAAAKEGKKKA